MKQFKTAVCKNKYKLFPVLFWIALWQVGSMVVDKEIFLASPIAVVEAFGKLVFKSVFWVSILNTFVKIAFGFFVAIFIGIALAIGAYHFLFFKELISPLMKVIQATPVASFIILALLWVHSKNLSILTSFLMVIPVIYANVLQGLYQTDKKLLEMAQVFRITPLKRARYLYIPGVMPYFSTASTVGLGLCWKAGIAAEVIGIPKNSIGEQLYKAKLYLLTGDLFAWTIVIILISILTEKVVIRIIKWIQQVVA